MKIGDLMLGLGMLAVPFVLPEALKIAELATREMLRSLHRAY
jgi:hypothetical protein